MKIQSLPKHESRAIDTVFNRASDEFVVGDLPSRRKPVSQDATYSWMKDSSVTLDYTILKTSQLGALPDLIGQSPSSQLMQNTIDQLKLGADDPRQKAFLGFIGSGLGLATKISDPNIKQTEVAFTLGDMLLSGVEVTGIEVPAPIGIVYDSVKLGWNVSQDDPDWFRVSLEGALLGAELIDLLGGTLPSYVKPILKLTKMGYSELSRC